MYKIYTQDQNYQVETVTGVIFVPAVDYVVEKLQDKVIERYKEQIIASMIRKLIDDGHIKFTEERSHIQDSIELKATLKFLKKI